MQEYGKLWHGIRDKTPQRFSFFTFKVTLFFFCVCVFGARDQQNNVI